MPRTEILTPEGFRADGRYAGERRNFKARMDLPTCRGNSDGSSLVCTGLTTVMCTVSGPKEPSANLRGQAHNDRAFLNVSYLVAPFSSQERKKVGRMDKRVQEMQISIERTFNEVVLLQLHPRSQIDIAITVLQQDGGAASAAINAVTLALIDAGIPLYTFVSSTTAGIELSESLPRTLLDLTSAEESDISFLTVATEGLGSGDKINFLLCETKMPLNMFESTLQAAVEGCRVIKLALEEVCKLAGKEFKASLEREEESCAKI